MQTNAIVLPPDDPQGQINAILNGLGKIDCQVSAFEAIYLVSALQLALSHPRMLESADAPPTKAVENFARSLTEGLSRHPGLTTMLAHGWAQVDLARQGHQKIQEALAEVELAYAALKLPTRVKELRALCVVAGVKNGSRLRKRAAVEALKKLPKKDLIQAHTQWQEMDEYSSRLTTAPPTTTSTQ